MTTVERIKTICKERNTPISKLEKDLGFANGYISQLKRGSLPDNRLNAVADYFQVSPLYLSTGIDSYERDPDIAILARIKSRIPDNLFKTVVKIALLLEDHFTTANQGGI